MVIGAAFNLDETPLHCHKTCLYNWEPCTVICSLLSKILQKNLLIVGSCLLFKHDDLKIFKLKNVDKLPAVLPFNWTNYSHCSSGTLEWCHTLPGCWRQWQIVSTKGAWQSWWAPSYVKIPWLIQTQLSVCHFTSHHETYLLHEEARFCHGFRVFFLGATATETRCAGSYGWDTWTGKWLDWFKGKFTGNDRFSHSIWGFPVDFPLNQSIETGIGKRCVHLILVCLKMANTSDPTWRSSSSLIPSKYYSIYSMPSNETLA